MKNKLKLLSLILFIVNILLTLSLTVFFIELAVNGISSLEAKLMMTISVFLFMFVFAGGVIQLLIYNTKKYSFLLKHGIINILPIPYFSILSSVMAMIFIMKINSFVVEDIEINEDDTKYNI